MPEKMLLTGRGPTLEGHRRAGIHDQDEKLNKLRTTTYGKMVLTRLSADDMTPYCAFVILSCLRMVDLSGLMADCEEGSQLMITLVMMAEGNGTGCAQMLLSAFN